MPGSDRRVRGAYPAREHREENRESILRFVEETALGAMVTWDGSGFASTNLPFTVVVHGEKIHLHGHMPRSNPQSVAGGPTMVLFQGPGAYVRPGWYPSKKADGRAVPTWNYMVARLHGTLEIVDDPAFVLEQVTALSARHEAGQSEPWSPADAPPRYLAGMVRALVGLRIPVDRLEGVWKLSQNHPESNRLGVVAGLRSVGSGEASMIADAMVERESERSDGEQTRPLARDHLAGSGPAR